MRRFPNSGLARLVARVLIVAFVLAAMPVPLEASYGRRDPLLVTKDELGNRITQTDANSHVTSFEYDRLGRETARILPGGARETKEYDAAGNLTRRVDFAGRETLYTHDSNNRPASRTYPGGSAENVSFTYTATGRLETITDGFGTTQHAYDLRDRIASIVYPGGSKLAMGHDPNGNRATLTAYPVLGDPIPAGFRYDDANRLDLATDARAMTYGLGYDPNGNRTGLSQPNGTSTTYAYDALNRLTNLTTVGAIGTVQSYGLTLGPAGNRTRIVQNGGVARDYSYDALYRLTQEKWTDGASVIRQDDLTYDNVGNRLTRTLATSSGTTTTTYGYDERDRLLTETGIAGGYSYDDNGNLTTKDGEATYLWDRESRLTKVSKTDGTVVECAYDAFGNRIQTKTTLPGQPTETTNYLVDTSGSLSHVVAELDEAGRLKTYYLRADNELIALLRPDGSGGYTAKYPHADYVGSIRALTDDSGQVTDTYLYDGFGTLLQHQGIDPQPYAFAGEPYDPNVGFQYHRARHYDPRVGRFVGMDPFVGWGRDPITLHRYVYAGIDPLNKKDPSGRELSLAGLAVVAGIISGLASAAITAYRGGNAREIVRSGLIVGVGAGLAVYVGLVAVAFWTAGVLAPEAAGFGTRVWPSPNGTRQVIGGLEYTDHALQRMAPYGLIQRGTEIVSRGVPPSVVEHAIEYGTKAPGNTADTVVHTFEQVVVVTNTAGTRVITVITTAR